VTNRQKNGYPQKEASGQSPRIARPHVPSR
jgi:hypothetical protein